METLYAERLTKALSICDCSIRTSFSISLRSPWIFRNISIPADIFTKKPIKRYRRGLIADPYWVNKVQSGREDELRKCIYCNIGCCASRMRQMRPIHCTVNPDVTNNDEYIF